MHDTDTRITIFYNIILNLSKVRLVGISDTGIDQTFFTLGILYLTLLGIEKNVVQWEVSASYGGGYTC